MQKKKKKFQYCSLDYNLNYVFSCFFTLIPLSSSVSTVILEDVARNANTGTPTLIFDF